MSLRIRCLTFLATALMAASAGAAEIKFKTDGGFRAETDDGKFKFRLAGRIQMDFDSFNDAYNEGADGATGSDIYFRRVRAALTGTVYHNWSYKLQYEFKDSGGEFKDIYIRYKAGGVTITAGQFKEPFSLNELTSSKYISFIERSAPSELFSPGRNKGFGLSGKGDAFTWAVGLFKNSLDSNDAIDWAGTGRVTFTPIKSDSTIFHVGAAFTTRNGEFDGIDLKPEVRSANRGRISNDIVADRFQALGLEVAFRANRFHAASEYYDGKYSGAAGNPDHNVKGYYIEAGFFLTDDMRSYKGGKWDKVKPGGDGGAWQIVTRWSNADSKDNATGGELEQWTLGLNWYINSNTTLKLDYIRGDYSPALAGSNTGELFDKGNALSGRLQLFW